MMRRVFSVTAVALVLAVVARAGEENSAVKPVERKKGDQPDVKWLGRHVNFVIEAKKGGIEVLFLGDSITDAWRNKSDKGGKEVWDKYFAPLKAANFGIGGDRTQHVLWRVQRGEMEGIQPKVAVVMIGTNNLGSNSDAEIAAGIKAVVKAVRDKSPDTKVLFSASSREVPRRRTRGATALPRSTKKSPSSTTGRASAISTLARNFLVRTGACRKRLCGTRCT
jgi:hypothetical protein